MHAEEINTRQQTWGAHRKTCENKSQHNRRNIKETSKKGEERGRLVAGREEILLVVCLCLQRMPCHGTNEER
jgi:hypothetical protein